jgi:hypothetical protein
MKKELFVSPPPVIEPLALRPRDAAQAIGISERLLWDWAHQHGLPYVQLERLVVYPVEGLRLWLREHSTAAEPSHLTVSPVQQSDRPSLRSQTA